MLVSPCPGAQHVKLRPSVSDLAAGFPLAGVGSAAHPGDAAQVHLLALWCRVWALGGRSCLSPGLCWKGWCCVLFSFCASDTFPLAMETIPGMSCCCSNRSVWQWSSSFQQQPEQSQRDIVLTFPSLWTGVWSQTVLSLEADEAGMAHVNSPFHLS